MLNSKPSKDWFLLQMIYPRYKFQNGLYKEIGSNPIILALYSRE